ncbi:hypothetical protein PAHA111176_00940 [Parendozoicomonas haliclonae]|uniref:Spore Coat Protein U domain protein n=2 Tax=Parendozoicomonas haliclonae TaxID=1960125 RepID=A0A1X7AG45_9GAMM|nr:hypothetical protein EHSB41UT_00993 [Parendozoicomonas haliclonae]
MVFITLFNTEAQAFFDFNYVTTGQLNWNPENNNSLQVAITVGFSSWCSSGCIGQEYRLAIFDDYQYGTPVLGPQPVLNKYLNGPVKWSQGGQSASFNPGEWSTAALTTHTNGQVTGTLTLTFDRDVLGGLQQGSHQFTFMLVGEDTENTTHIDKRLVSILINIPSTVKISNLEDVNLFYAEWSGSWIWKQTTFCVFDSLGGWYRISFNGANNPGGSFELKSAAGRQLHYRVSYQTPGSNWQLLNAAGMMPRWFQGSRSLDCNGQNNAILRVEIYGQDVYKVPVDTYSDTLTITVSVN